MVSAFFQLLAAIGIMAYEVVLGIGVKLNCRLFGEAL